MEAIISRVYKGFPLNCFEYFEETDVRISSCVLFVLSHSREKRGGFLAKMKWSQARENDLLRGTFIFWRIQKNAPPNLRHKTFPLPPKHEFMISSRRACIVFRIRFPRECFHFDNKPLFLHLSIGKRLN